MRWQAQLGMGLFGLAVAVPAWAQNVPAGMQAPTFNETTSAGASAAYPTAATSRHQHKGLFGWQRCTECQRARAKSRDGVDVPPPPSASSLPPGTVVPGAIVYGHPHGGATHANSQPGTCVACEQAAAGTVVTSGPVVISDSNAPGYASVGGPSAPGYASVGGPAPVGGDGGPAPVGVARAHTGQPSPIAARSPLGTHDSSVMPTSAAIPAAPTPMGDDGPTKPHVIGHLFGFSQMAKDYRDRRAQRSQKEREAHAAIAYDEKSQPLTEIPASMVYGNDGHNGR